jgi:hypothetical protein
MPISAGRRPTCECKREYVDLTMSLSKRIWSLLLDDEGGREVGAVERGRLLLPRLGTVQSQSGLLSFLGVSLVGFSSITFLSVTNSASILGIGDRNSGTVNIYPCSMTSMSFFGLRVACSPLFRGCVRA